MQKRKGKIKIYDYYQVYFHKTPYIKGKNCDIFCKYITIDKNRNKEKSIKKAIKIRDEALKKYHLIKYEHRV